MFNIVLKNTNFILASCPTLEIAEERLKEMIERDKELQKQYNWKKLPKYEIKERK